jgi:hypothetical protein
MKIQKFPFISSEFCHLLTFLTESKEELIFLTGPTLLTLTWTISFSLKFEAESTLLQRFFTFTVVNSSSILGYSCLSPSSCHLCFEASVHFGFVP